MSFSLYLLLSSEEPIQRQYIADFIEDGSYFETTPKFEPVLDHELGDLTIRLTGEGTVQFKKLDADEKESAIAEALGSLGAAPIPDKGKEALSDRIGKTTNVIEVLVNREKMTKDSWAMLDALEADILRSRDGLLYVYGEGIYGPNLRLWPSP